MKQSYAKQNATSRHQRENKGERADHGRSEIGVKFGKDVCSLIGELLKLEISVQSMDTATKELLTKSECQLILDNKRELNLRGIARVTSKMRKELRSEERALELLSSVEQSITILASNDAWAKFSEKELERLRKTSFSAQSFLTIAEVLLRLLKNYYSSSNQPLLKGQVCRLERLVNGVQDWERAEIVSQEVMPLLASFAM